MKKIGKGIALATALLLLATTIPYFPSRADKAGSIKQQIEQTEGEKKQAEEEKRQAEEQKQQQEGHLSELTIKQGDLKVKLNSLNEEMSEAADRLEDVEARLAAKEKEIEEALAELEEAKATEEAQYEAMKKRFKASYEAPKETYFTILLGSTSFASFLNNTDYLRMVADYDSKMLEQYKQTKEQVIEKEERLEEEKIELEELKTQEEEENRRISELIATTSNYMTQYQAQINTANKEIQEYAAEIAAKESLIKQQEDNLAALRAQYEKELALSRAAQAAAWRNISEVAFEADDRTLLATIIYCEAGNQPYEGKLAVGAVVCNRVRSGSYPNNIHDVIYAKGQFGPAYSGSLAKALERGVSESCRQAAQEALNGATNVGGACHFHRAGSREGVVIGDHVFY